jgi:hypothetical protein
LNIAASEASLTEMLYAAIRHENLQRPRSDAVRSSRMEYLLSAHRNTPPTINGINAGDCDHPKTVSIRLTAFPEPGGRYRGTAP